MQLPLCWLGGLAGATLVVAGFALLYGGPKVKEWLSSWEAQEDVGYYRLPPKDAAADAEARAITEDLFDAQAESIEAGVCDDSPAPTARRGLCVCCHDLCARFVFVRCGHICLCEPCLIRLGHEELAQRGVVSGGGAGACQLQCPLCRCRSYIVKTYVG